MTSLVLQRVLPIMQRYRSLHNIVLAELKTITRIQIYAYSMDTLLMFDIIEIVAGGTCIQKTYYYTKFYNYRAGNMVLIK